MVVQSVLIYDQIILQKGFVNISCESPQ